MGAITSGKVCTLLKKDLKGNELNKDNASKKPMLSSKKSVVMEN